MGVRRAGNRQRFYALNKLGKSAVNSPGNGAASGVVSSTIIRNGHEIITEIAVDLGSSQGQFKGSGTANDVIAVSASLVTDHKPGYLTQLSVANNGHLVAVDMTCLEAPTTGPAAILLIGNSASKKYDEDATAGTATTLISCSNAGWSLGDFSSFSFGDALSRGALPVSGNVAGETYYLYLAQGAGATGLYDAGKYVIRLYGIAVPNDK